MAAALVIAGCSKENRALSKIEGAFEREDYVETVALCRHAIRSGVDAAGVYYYYGAALVSMERDFEGFRRLDDAVRRDSDRTDEVAAFLFAQGEAAFRGGQQARAASRFRKASEVVPSLDLGRYAYVVGDSFFEERDHARAAALYERAIASCPDTAAAARAYLNKAECYSALNDRKRARESLQDMLARFRQGPLAVEARWRLANMLYEEAERQFRLGNYEQTASLTGRVLDSTNNPGLIQKSRFLRGEAFEAMGKFGEAYEQYRAIIEGERGASGRVVERAREKIAAFREAGRY